MSFGTSSDAKEFLISRIVKEAKRLQVPLSDVERKMLYFSESCPSLPDMAEISERFERECDDEEYERKISRLSKSAYRRDRRESPDTARLWKGAIDLLKREDHYILAMIDVPHYAGDVGKLIFTAVVVIALGFAIFLGVGWIRRHFVARVPDSIQLPAFILCLAVLCFFAWNEKAGKKVGRLIDWMIERVIRWY